MIAKIGAILLSLGFWSSAKANIYALNTTPVNQNCQVVTAPKQSGPGLKYLSCKEKTQEHETTKPFLIVKSEFRDLPDLIKFQFENKKGSIKEWDQVYVSISTENDDLVLFGLCKARDTSCSDDSGYTVGSSIALGAVYQGKYDVQMKLSNGLYTKPVPGKFHYDSTTQERSEEQYFRTSLLMEFLISSARQKNLHYWSLGTGLIGISSEEKFGFMDAAKQQRSLHKILNGLGRDLAVDRINTNDGQKDQWGFYLLAGLGVQKFLGQNGSPFSSRSYAQITPRLSTLSKHSELRLEAGSDLGYKVGSDGRISTGALLASTFHGDGQLNEATVFIKYENGKKWETSLGFTCQRGKLANYVSYNSPNIVTGKPECKVRNYKPAFFPYQPPRRFGPKGLLMEFRLQIL